MIYLTTGSNGTGKTLFNLKWVRDLQISSNRPVFHNGRFKLKPEIAAEFGWQEFKASEWESLPDGAIILLDEAHNDLPVRPAGQKPPEWIAKIAEHRLRGMDFFLITQHPTNIDNFVRKLIGSPGWHRHLKRVMGLDAVTCVEYTFAHTSPERPASKEEGDPKRMGFPKEVYGWYDSAVMHTGKRSIPGRVWVGIGALAALLAFGGYAYTWVSGYGEEKAPEAASAAPKTTATTAAPGTANPHLSKAEWLASFQPRISELPHTAPRYDEVTKPTTAPRPAACMQMGRRCECFTQQGTRLPQVGQNLCEQIVADGYFIDWSEVEHSQVKQQHAPQARLEQAL